MSASDNYLFNQIIDNSDPAWLGEILIVKTNASGYPIDICEDDLDILPTLLRRLVTSVPHR